MYTNLNEFIQFLEQKGELIRVSHFVDPILEITEIIDRISKSPGGGKAILFENTGTDFPVLINAWGSDKRISYALGVSEIEEIPKRINELFLQVASPKASLWEKLSLLPTLIQASQWMPKVVKNKKAPCQEVVMSKPNLNSLPILQCWPHDGGRFITLPLVHTRSLTTGMRNVGVYRMQVFDNDCTGMHWHRHKTGAKHFEEYREAGKRMPIAVVLGGDPAYTWSGTAPLPDNLDEYLLAGFIRNRSVRLVPCLTQDIEVPEDADIVIEGYVDPAETLVTEGPFGDHTGFYSLEDFYPKFHVTCITHRSNAIYPTTIVGIPPQEDTYLAKATERVFLAPIKMLIAPEVSDMYLPEMGVAHNLAILSIHKSYPGQAVKVAHALWGAGQMMFCKIIIVTDSTVDIHNVEQLIQASSNWNPQTDTYFSKGPLDVLDHAAQQMGFGGKMCLDFTSKLLEEKTDESVDTLHSFAQFIHEGDVHKPSKIVITLDSQVDIHDYDTCAWLTGNNIDVERDCKIINNVLHIDAQTKAGRADFHRPWPNVVCMDDATIKLVDEKWGDLGLGDLLESPSNTFKTLLKEGKARVNIL